MRPRVDRVVEIHTTPRSLKAFRLPRMRRLVACVLLFLWACAGATASDAHAGLLAAHPCRLVSNGEVARILAGAHLEVGGSTCRIHRGARMVGVITINTDTRARFSAFRRNIASYRRIVPVRGVGEEAFLDVFPKDTFRPYTLYVFQRGHRLLVTSFSTRFTSAQGRRVAAVVAPRI